MEVLPSYASSLEDRVKRIRALMEGAFSPDTAFTHAASKAGSGGQCAPAALILNRMLGGSLVSARVRGESHWFNRIKYRNRWFDVDITGDQYGFSSVRVSNAGALYDGTKVRLLREVQPETWQRTAVLAARAKIGLKQSRFSVRSSLSPKARTSKTHFASRR